MNNAFTPIDCKKILDAKGPDFLKLPGVTGVGVGYRGPNNEVLCFIVSVKNDNVKIDLPQTIEGLPSCKEVSSIVLD